MKKLILPVVLMIFSFMATTSVDAQQIQSWKYYKMNNWDTSPYKAFRFTASNGQPMNFRLLYPKNYDSSKKYPMIVMLHGYGEAGRRNVREFYSTDDPRYDNNDHQLLHGGREHLSAYYNNKFDGFILFAQNDYGSWVGGKGEATSSMHRDMVKLLELVEYLTDSYLKLDPFRIYLHGLSNGGAGTWYAAYKRPDMFAAVLPMSNAGDLAMAPTLAYHPIWLFQGAIDTNPRPFQAKAMIDELKKYGALPRYTEYANTGHGTWYKAYAEPDFFSFMSAQHKLKIHVAFGKDEFCGNESFTTKLGISPGFQAYEWRRNGQLISGATSNAITVSQYGDYQVRVKRKGIWSEWGPIRTVRDRCGTTTNRAPVFNSANNMTVTAGTSQSQTITASDPDGDAVKLSMASGAPSFVSFTDNGGGKGTLTASPGSTVSGNFTVTLQATDTKLTTNKSLTITVQTSGGGGGGGAGEVVYRIDAGGGADISASPMPWSRDSQANPSQYLDPASNNNTAGASSFTRSNSTGAPNQLFATMRFGYSWGGPLKYNFPVDNGEYEVRLYFAESPYSYGATAAGQRVFDIKLENAVAINDQDIYARAGKNADMRTATVNVTDGTLNVEFVRQVGNPQVNGIEIIRGGSTTTTAAASTKTGTSTTASVESGMDVNAYPSIFENKLTVEIKSQAEEPVRLRITDLMGRSYYEADAMARPNADGQVIDLQNSRMERGMYLLEVSSPASGERKVMRIYKQE